jgi:hypothetical protein
MISQTENIQESQLQSFSKLLILISFFFLGQVVGGLIAILILMPVFQIGLNDFISLINLTSPRPDLFYIIILLQGITSLVTFIGGSLFFLKKIDNKNIASLSPVPAFNPLVVLLSVSIVLASAILSGYFLQITQSIDFQQWGSLGRWITTTEENAKQLTEQLTKFDSFGAFLLAMIVIALIPAIGEELLFRGLMQSKIGNIFKNTHVAVWITAAIFSFIHFQFYGFLSRMMLGVLFGYMYVWSGNIIYPIVAHFTNNGAQVLLLYLYQQKIINYNIDNDSKISVGLAIGSLLIIVLLMILFKNLTRKKSNSLYTTF